MTTVVRVPYPDTGKSQEPVQLLEFPFPVHALLSTRFAGEMGASGGDLTPARAALLDQLAVKRSHFVTLKQVHSRTVHAVAGGVPMYGADGDGMVTEDHSAVLGVTVADCMPIFLADPTSGAFGLLHSGWRGTGIVRVAIELMAGRFGSTISNIQVLLGPAIGACCYNVDAERAAAFSAEWGECSVRWADRVPFLDLRAANIELLKQCGVRSVAYVDACTACTESLASFRRQGPDDYTGMLAVCGHGIVPPAAMPKNLQN